MLEPQSHSNSLAHIRVSRAHSHQSSSPACFQQLSRHRCAQFWERRCRSDPAAHIPFLIQQVPTAKRPGWVALPALCSTAAPLSPGKTKRCPHFAANPSAFQRTKLYAFRPWNLGQILLSPLLPPPPGARSEPALCGRGDYLHTHSRAAGAHALETERLRRPGAYTALIPSKLLRQH